ncbi:dihydrofolate reductase family protein [Microbacterium sp. SD291]|uniref:RibD family protein n=1 Tax=Microbacterium sp. SD291 TaxID=2782007 RepID=UPI001F623D72|nr:dihydrofolate reductase family protein [Microbacterium sp. SD291]
MAVVIGSRPAPDDAAVRRHPHPPLFYDTRDLRAVVADLHARGIQTVFVEGGPTLASAFLSEGLFDRVLAYIAPVLLGGDKLALTDIGVPTIDAARRLRVDEWLPLGQDLLAIAHPAHTTEEGAA